MKTDISIRAIIFKSIIPVLLSLAVLLFSAEMYVRFVADDGMRFDLEMWKYASIIKQPSNNILISHEHQPNKQAKLMGVNFQTNSDGLRDRDYTFDKVPGTIRIMMLGDSLTVGWGVPFDETFSKRVEQNLNELGVKSEVINTGVGNYNTIQEVEYFFTKGIKYNPDIIVLNYFVNDAEPVPQKKNPTLFDKYCMSCIYFRGRFDILKRQMKSSKSWVDYYLSLYDNGNSVGWHNSQNYIMKLADYCKNNDIKLLLVSLPELHDVNNYKLGVVTDLLKTTANQKNIEFVDVLENISTIDSSKLWVSVPDPHPNGLANKYISEALTKKLVDSGWLNINK